MGSGFCPVIWIEMRIEYIAQNDTLSIELPGAKVGDSLQATAPEGLLYWYDIEGNLRGVTIPNAANLLGWTPTKNIPFSAQRRPLFNEMGQVIGWEAGSGNRIF